jgi:hypothetical protein
VLADEEADERHDTRHQRDQYGRRGESLVLPGDEPVRQGTQPKCTERCPREVDVCRGGRVVGFRDMTDSDHHDGDGERQVDEEDPSPGRDLHQPATEERSGCARDARQAGPRADRPAAVLGPERGLQDGQTSGGEQRAANTL